jgi:hypothetical protein
MKDINSLGVNYAKVELVPDCSTAFHFSSQIMTSHFIYRNSQAVQSALDVKIFIDILVTKS